MLNSMITHLSSLKASCSDAWHCLADVVRHRAALLAMAVKQPKQRQVLTREALLYAPCVLIFFYSTTRIGTSVRMAAIPGPHTPNLQW